MRKRLAVLVCALALTGCRSWNVNLFGVDLNHVKAQSELSTDEKVGVVVVLGAAIAIGVGVAIAAD